MPPALLLEDAVVPMEAAWPPASIMSSPLTPSPLPQCQPTGVQPTRLTARLCAALAAEAAQPTHPMSPTLAALTEAAVREAVGQLPTALTMEAVALVFCVLMPPTPAMPTEAVREAITQQVVPALECAGGGV